MPKNRNAIHCKKCGDRKHGIMDTPSMQKTKCHILPQPSDHKEVILSLMEEMVDRKRWTSYKLRESTYKISHIYELKRALKGELRGQKVIGKTREGLEVQMLFYIAWEG